MGGRFRVELMAGFSRTEWQVSVEYATANVLAVVHASERLSDANRQRCEKINARVGGRKITLVFLWEFIARSFRLQFPDFDQKYIRVMHPLAYLPSFTQNSTSLKRCKIAVPGALSFVNRDYRLLVDALRICNDETLEMIEVVLPGAASAATLEQMTGMLKEANLEGLFSIPTLASADRKSRTAYQQYYDEISDATVIMPLFKTTSKYRSVSMSSTVATAYCMNLPVALNSSDSVIYDVPYSLINQYDYLATLNRLVSDDFQLKRERLKIQQAASMASLLAKNVETLRACLLSMY
ncbi:MAG: hypothetical protein LW629_10040 [Burkholderiales bacterium]|nr:hypothetical protein [Burkholderiales bacterium]